ncbi:MAG: protein-L-isoaspartate O-methyltransferase [Promethearchaeota archaeon]
MSNKRSLEEKQRTIERLKKSGSVSDPKVIQAFLKVPREEFVNPDLRNEAYIDTPLPIGHGQTISAIHMVLMMSEVLDLQIGHKMLEVGAGSGYHAAICAEIVAPQDAGNKGHVFSIERVPNLAEFAKKNLERAGYGDRVTVILGDGTCGLQEEAPFDRILVTAAGPTIPRPLIEQLKETGKLVIPIGQLHLWQDLVLVEKTKRGIRKKRLCGVAFVPLKGKYGWK